MRRVLLIDDEAAARAELRWLLSPYAGHAVVGEAATFARARARLDEHDYDLVFLDVQLVGGNGFDLVPHVARAARIIFVTAFDKFAVRAFEVNALDYLLKPVSTERFAVALAKSTSESAAAPRAAFRADDTVLIQTDDGKRFVPLAKISAVLSNENYSDVLLRTGERLLTRRTMKIWEDLLPSAQFIRVHRQAIVNLAAIENHRRDTRETLELSVAGAKEAVPVSRSFVAALKLHLDSAAAS
ncbi:MAG TPA: LytTR family DNA-binding domain-containing protein [Acidobacteriota bacterium]|nr:LytTR family DNA-binding domain-containing protein [Acidobacteriota bacterium]